jgi:hypothetical protein
MEREKAAKKKMIINIKLEVHFVHALPYRGGDDKNF